MRLATPYVLPFRVMYQPEVATGKRDIVMRIYPVDTSGDLAESLNATVLPFCLMATSGAFAGASIQPWNSTIVDWTNPVTRDSAIEWSFASVNFDPQSWVILAQMLLVDHGRIAIHRVEILDSKGSMNMMDVITGKPQFNPYPRRWAGVKFATDFQGDISKSFTVCAAFSRQLTADEQKKVDEELFAWAPGLMLGAYGVAPVPPDRCTALPDKDLVFVDNELEWSFSNFKAHTFALEGLINVFASISHKVAPVTGFRIE